MINLIKLFIPKLIKQLCKKFIYEKHFKNLTIDKTSFISDISRVTMGEYVWIGANVNIFPSVCGIKFGNNIFIASSCIFYGNWHHYEQDKMLPFDYDNVCFPIEIGDNVWFGSNLYYTPWCKN